MGERSLQLSFVPHTLKQQDVIKLLHYFVKNYEASIHIKQSL